MPRVSVVIPAFNAEAVLAQTLDSVLKSTFDDFEVVVVDDGSTDTTAAVASSFGGRVRLIRQPNSGAPAARNLGIRESTGELIALLDSDDLWHPEKLSLQVAAMDAAPEAGVCFSAFVVWTGLSPAVFDAAPTGELDARFSGWIYHQMILTNFVLPSSAIVRRGVFDREGLFLTDRKNSDDWEYFVRTSRHWPFLKLAARLVAYRQSPGSLSRRVDATNVGEALREELIQRYGLTSPQGIPVNQQDLARRRYKGRRDFADRHLARGRLDTGFREFAQLLIDGPSRGATTLCMLNSLRRRYFPSSTVD